MFDFRLFQVVDLRDARHSIVWHSKDPLRITLNCVAITDSIRLNENKQLYQVRYSLWRLVPINYDTPRVFEHPSQK